MEKNYSQLVVLVVGLLLFSCKTDKEKLSEYGLSEEPDFEYSLVDNLSNNINGKYKIQFLNDEFIEEGDEVLLVLGEVHLRVFDHSVRFNLNPDTRTYFRPTLYLKRNNYWYSKYNKVKFSVNPKYDCYTMDLTTDDLVLYVGCD